MNFDAADLPVKIDPELAWLQLLHLADSALPIGAMAHSFGLEGLVVEAGLNEAYLRIFFTEWLCGTGRAEAVFLADAQRIRSEGEWRRLNGKMSSFKIAAESRAASLRLGRRFLSLATMLIGSSVEDRVAEDPRLTLQGDAHFAAAFGIASGLLGISAQTAAAAYLHQSIYGAISCCQRLMPFGQSAAMILLWSLKPMMIEIAREASALQLDDLWNLQPMLEIASMRHPYLETRLFIS